MKANVYDFDRLYRRTKIGLGVTDSLVRLSLSPIPPNTLRVLTHVTVENKGHSYTKCRVGIATPGRDHYLDELTTIAANELAVSRSDVLLGEGDSFFAELTGTTTGDELVMTCAGWEQHMK